MPPDRQQTSRFETNAPYKVTVKKHQKNTCYLDLDQMNLILKLDLDMVVPYVHAKNEVSRSKGSNVTA